ncbi:hypothetical protein TNCV_3910641 [Trichonephila clavipes]|nr:hypothetical protein TNCV_3910641 [Trichonephila clavipes]
MCKAVIHYRKRKLMSGIDVSEKAGKVLKTTNALNVHRLPAPPKTSKRFLRWYVGQELAHQLSKEPAEWLMECMDTARSPLFY